MAVDLTLTIIIATATIGKGVDAPIAIIPASFAVGIIGVLFLATIFAFVHAVDAE